MEGVIDGLQLYVLVVLRIVLEFILILYVLVVFREILNVDLNQLFEEYMFYISIKNCRYFELVLKLQLMIFKIILLEDQVFVRYK